MTLRQLKQSAGSPQHQNMHRTLANSWREHAACLNHPRLKPSAWDDDIVGHREPPGSRARRVTAAKAVCLGCPVIGPCLADVDLDYDRGGHDLRDIADARRRARAGR